MVGDLGRENLGFHTGNLGRTPLNRVCALVELTSLLRVMVGNRIEIEIEIEAVKQAATTTQVA